MRASPIRRLRGIPVAFLVVTAVATSGCAGVSAAVGDGIGTPAATPAPSASSSPSDAAPQQVFGTQVIIDGTRLSLATDDGTVLDSVAYTDDPLVARARLTDWLAVAPASTSVVDDHYCAQTTEPIVHDSWDDAFLLTHSSPGGEEGYRFSIIATGAAVDTIALSTPQGFSVGDSSDDLIAAIPHVPTEVGSGVTRIYYDQSDPQWAAYAWAWEGEPIEEIRAPYALDEYC